MFSYVGNSVMTFIMSHPLMICACLFILYRIRQASQPIPDYGGNVRVVHSLMEWKAIQKEAIAKSVPVIADFYANWCPPCRMAAPVFAELSLEYDRVIFCKINVDNCRDVCSAVNFSGGIPQFHLYKDGTKQDEVVGFSKGRLEGLVSKSGALQVKKSS